MIDDKRILWKGDSVYTMDSGWYRINDIKRIEQGKYRSSTMERTDSTMMMFPLFGSTHYEMCYKDYFMNAFIYHEEHDWQDNIIWVLMKKPIRPDIRYDRAIDLIRNGKRCVKEEQLGSNFTLFTMKLPEIFEKDFSMFKLSKFSKMSDNAKSMIYRFHNISEKSDNPLRLQLSRSPIYKKYLEDKIGIKELPPNAELHSAIDDQRECFRYNYIIEDIR